MAIFRFFKMAAAVILDFSNLKFLMVGRLKKADLHRRAKFGRNRSNRGRDMAIFQFFQDGGCPPSWICYVCSDHPRRVFGGLYRCAKFGWNRCSCFDNMHVFRFHEFGLKTPIHAPKIGVFEDLTPYMGSNINQQNPKWHILARVHVV